MIKLSNLKVAYGERVIFDNAEFLVRPGDRIGLVGPNGAGKTTLFRVIAGEEKPDSGDVNADPGTVIATKTAVWYHIGLNDGAARVSVAQASLEKFRSYPCNSGARERNTDDAIDSYQRETVYLKRGNYDMFIYSEYTGMGHTRDPVYKDPNIFPWMFSHSLALR